MFSFFPLKAFAQEELSLSRDPLSKIEYTPRILPTSPFYFLKQWKEKLELMLAITPEKRAAKRLEIANRRLAELRVVAKKRPDLVKKLSAHYGDQLKNLEKELQRVKGEEEKRRLTEHVSEVTLKHQEILLQVYQKVPKEAREGIQTALEKSIKGHQRIAEEIKGKADRAVLKRLEERRKRIIERLGEIEGKVEDKQAKEMLEKLKERINKAEALPFVPQNQKRPLELKKEKERNQGEKREEVKIRKLREPKRRGSNAIESGVRKNRGAEKAQVKTLQRGF